MSDMDLKERPKGSLVGPTLASSGTGLFFGDGAGGVVLVEALKMACGDLKVFKLAKAIKPLLHAPKGIFHKHEVFAVKAGKLLLVFALDGRLNGRL